MSVVPFRKSEYVAQAFKFGQFQASGTLCGHVDFIGPWKGSIVLSPDEIYGLVHMLECAREDVLNNSHPLDDPRLYDSDA